MKQPEYVCPWCGSGEFDVACDFCNAMVCDHCFATWKWVGNGHKLLGEGTEHLRLITDTKGKKKCRNSKRSR